MDFYVKLYHNSTGYVQGTIPPVFDENNIKPIPMCGSDSIILYDGRWSHMRVYDYAQQIIKDRENVTGFVIHRKRKESNYYAKY